MGRGPSYPYTGLEESIALARKMFDYAKRAPASLESVITEAWKYSPSSSSGLKIVAALRAFGLIEDVQNSNSKAIKLTARAIRILLDDANSVERREEIKKAALSPNWYGRCWKKWGPEMPPSMRASLLIDEGFVDTTVDAFLRDYRKSLAFAGLLDDINPVENAESSESDDNSASSLDRVESGSQDSSRPQTRSQELTVSPSGSSPKRTGNPYMRVETVSFSDGVTATVEWPPSITEDALTDLAEWFEGLRKRMGRTVQKELATEGSGDGEKT